MSRPAEQLPSAMTLRDLLEGIVAAPAIPLTDITTDSRRVRAGSLFLACRGQRSHGLDYLDDVARRGALAVAYDSTAGRAPAGEHGLEPIPVPFLCDRLGALANRFFGAPSHALDVIGVTGTNGKSTVAWLIAQCLTRLGERCAYAGTLGYGVDEMRRDDEMTSPDAIESHRRLAGFREQGATCAAIEVSSHALDQRRVNGVRFDAAIFTNLSRDHLDYHGDMAAYGAAKARLFEDYDARHRIVNVDSSFGEDLAARCGSNVMVVGSHPDFAAPAGDYAHLRVLATHAEGSRVGVDSSAGRAEFELPLIGGFNVANAACVLGLLLTRGYGLDVACDALAHVTAPPGRMERVPANAGLSVYIDYAHTPDALRAALNAIRPHTAGALWCVFGCGGERDAGKRGAMGAIAADVADRVVVTTDNPRSESAARIIDDILAGMTDRSRLEVIEDRAAAIAYTVDTAADGDTVLVAGKGHEDYQLVAGQRLAFSDFEVAAAALEAREGRA